MFGFGVADLLGLVDLSDVSGLWYAWWLGTLIASLPMALTLLAMGRARRTSASTRHFVYVAALCGAVFLPLMAHVAPRWELALLPEQEQVAFESGAAGAPDAASAVGAPVVAATEQAPAELRELLPSVLAALWILGALAIVLRRLRAERALRQLEDASIQINSKVWRGVLDTLLQELDIRRDVRLITHADARTPATWGLWRTVVLLPDSAQNWSEHRRRAVLLHELGHVRRGDVWSQLFVDLSCALLWFHPLAWSLRKRIESERENACDDVVLRSGARPSSYAQVLYDMYERLSCKTPELRMAASFALLEGKRETSTMERRLSCLLDPERERGRGNTRMRGLLIGCSIALALPVAGAELVHVQAELQETLAPESVAVEPAAETLREELVHADTADLPLTVAPQPLAAPALIPVATTADPVVDEPALSPAASQMLVATEPEPDVESDVLLVLTYTAADAELSAQIKRMLPQLIEQHDAASGPSISVQGMWLAGGIDSAKTLFEGEPEFTDNAELFEFLKGKDWKELLPSAGELSQISPGLDRIVVEQLIEIRLEKALSEPLPNTIRSRGHVSGGVSVSGSSSTASRTSTDSSKSNRTEDPSRSDD